MEAVRYRLRVVLRRRRLSLVGLVLLVGLAGGVVLASVAAARRTDAAFSGMVQRTQAWDLLVNPNFGGSYDDALAAIAVLPHVVQAGGSRCASAVPDDVRTMHDLGNFTGSMALLDGVGYDFARPVIRDGRMPSADAPDELLIDQRYADRNGIAVGDVISMRVPSEAAIESGDLGGWVTGAEGRMVDMTVTGLGVTPDQVVQDEGYEALAFGLTPAFWEAYGHPDCGFWGIAVRLDDPSSEAGFRAAVEPMFPRDAEGQGGVNFQTLRATTDKVERAVRPEVATLEVFAAVMTLVGFLLVGQAVSRRLQNDTGDNLTLDAMGFDRRQRFAVSVAVVAVVALAGAVIAALLAFALSPLAPFGLARVTDPRPGWSFDGTVIGLGSVAVALVVVLVGLYPAWRTAAVTDRHDAVRPSVVTRFVARAGFGASATTGVRFALEPGRGRNAVPVRATLVGAVTAVAIVAVVLTFAGSLDNLLDTPALYGSGWDASVKLDASSGSLEDVPETAVNEIGRTLLSSSPLVTGSADVFAAELEIEGRPRPRLVALQPGDPPVGPTVVEGRQPTAPGEVALGANTMDTLGVAVGDRVAIGAEGADPTEHLVVGRVVLPGVGTYPGSDKTALGEGALLSLDGLVAMVPPLEQGFAVKMAPGTTVDQLQTSLRESLAGQPLPEGVAEAFVDVTRPNRPSDIVSLGRMRRTPLVLSGMLVLLVAGTVANALFLAVRRRRVDLAVLRALGATRRQLLATVGWQASTVAVVAGVVGVPLGVVIGRWIWTVLADALGTSAPPVVPWLALGVTGVIVVVLANLIGLIPGSRAARATPASVLRSE